MQKLPNSRDLKMVLAAQQADMGEADKALKDVRAMLKGDASSNSDDRQVYITLAQMNTRLRRFSDAEQALDKAEQLSIEDRTTKSTSGFFAARLLSARSATPKRKNSSRRCWPAIRSMPRR